MTAAGKVALVTGAARGMGAEFCRRLAVEGANVACVDLLDCAETIASMSGPGQRGAFRCDVSSPEAVAELLDEVTDALGACQILINNAALYPPKPFAQLTYEDWRRVQAVNVDSVFLTSTIFAPAMREAMWGRIINLGSSITLSQTTDLLPYIASKGAIHALTRALANELAAAGITVNALAPSIVATEGIHERATPVGGLSTEQELSLVASLQTIKRRSTPTDVANLMAFLVSDDADFMTGQIVHVSGGLVRSGA